MKWAFVVFWLVVMMLAVIVFTKVDRSYELMLIDNVIVALAGYNVGSSLYKAILERDCDDEAEG